MTPAARYPLASRTPPDRVLCILPFFVLPTLAGALRAFSCKANFATPCRKALQGVCINACGSVYARVTHITPQSFLVPLDTYAEWNVAYMRHCEGDEYPAITDEYTRILEKEEGENVKVVRLERFDFYERAKKSRFVLAIGEKALYANVIIKKGVVR